MTKTPPTFLDNTLKRTLFHALRHAPERYYLELDPDGWTSVEQMLLALRYTRPEWSQLKRSDLTRTVQVSLHDRIEIDGERIRATYGHSIAVRAPASSSSPPSVLYHGTSSAVYAQILHSGLHRRGRTFVHLTSACDYAREVAAGKGSWYVILEVVTKLAQESGIEFYPANRHVWLASSVPAHCLRLRVPSS